MEEKKKRKLIRRYFSRRGIHPLVIILALAGAGMLIFGGTNEVRLAGGIAILVFILVIAYRALTRPPSHEQIDEWRTQDLERLPDLAMKKLDLDRDDLVSDPLLVIGPVLWETNGIPSKELLYRVQKQKKRKTARFAVYHVTAILLTESHLGAYEADFNFLRNTYLNEHAQEFHYQDVVSVSLREDSTNLSLPDGEKAVHAEQFRLSVSSGENISVIVQARELRNLTGAEQDTGYVENVVTAIRKKLREKKSTIGNNQSGEY
jgi:hypothetical protein